MNREDIQSVLKQPYDRGRWLEILRSVLPGTDVFAVPQAVLRTDSHTESMLQLGRVRLRGGDQLAVLEIRVGGSIQLARNRVGLRNLIARLIDQVEYHGILGVFHSPESSDYRFTFAARQSVFDAEGSVAKRETAPRRFTYVLGPNETCRTAAERFAQLSAKAHDSDLTDVIEAFSVEKLNKEFFADFCRAFDKVRGEITQRYRWSDGTAKAEAQTLLNRLLFLYFVQRKGWLNRQRDYIISNFEQFREDEPRATTFHSGFLRPLFERLSTEEASSLLADHDLPFLNGGLFNDEYGDEQHDEGLRRRKEMSLSNETFRYIFDHLLEPYNFTIHEDSPTNYEVAIDPEMLGHIFEALVLQGEESEAGGRSARHDTGSHYTPRPIVHYLCRETLAAWLESQPPFSGRNDARIRIDEILALDATEGIDDEIKEQLERCTTPDEAAALQDRILELKACDPAVGSGAFPMGLLHELINLVRLCETRARGKDPVEHDLAWLYDSKKRIIESVLYGVDIQERAIEICKLRLWLSLMVDHDLEVDPAHCEVRAFRKALKHLDPLPNLDFKIRRANSLVDSIHGEPVNLGSLESGELAGPILNKLIVAKHDFYAAHTAKEKRRSRFKIYESTAELARHEVNWARNRLGLFEEHSNSAYIAELNRAQKEVVLVLAQIRAARKVRTAEQDVVLERVQAWFDDPRKSTFLWQLDFAEVFYRRRTGLASDAPRRQAGDTNAATQLQCGFDIVIGNPPYLRIQTLMKADPAAVAYYKENYAAAKKGNYDIYVVFVERGLRLLDKRHGQLGYILPHKFFNAQYGQPLRTLISSGKHLRHVVHFGDQQIFSGATNYVCLLFLAAAGTEECRFVRADDLKTWLETLRGVEGHIPSERIGAAEWNFAVGRGAGLFEHLTMQPVKLGDVAELFVGLQTSADNVFLFKDVPQLRNATVTVYSKALDKDVELETGLLKPVVRSGEIGRYWARATALVIFPYKQVNDRCALLSEPELREYPKTWRYLLANRELLEEREHRKFAESGWYQLYPKNLDLWEQPKVMLPYMITELAAYYDESNNYFVNVTTGGFGLTTSDERFTPRFLVGLLNSPVEDWFLKKVSTTFQHGYFAANKQFLVQLPIPEPSTEERLKVELLVDYLLWLRSQPSVADFDRNRPGDLAAALFFEQLVNCLIYELFFTKELHAAELHFFALLEDAGLPVLNSLPPGRLARLEELLRLSQKLQSPGNPVRVALDKLQTLDLVRIVEGPA